ncbi:MAG: two-component system regulatory protein YycI [Firmicutes bacterium]|nr:two-component system regulatory protein YycI [Bacillota bacterium]
MDLSRVKTVLIVAFLGLNIFLGYKLWLVPQTLRQASVLTREQMEQTAELLAEHGFELEVPLPKQIPRLALLHVSRQQLEDASWVYNFLGEQVPNVQYADGKTVYTVGAASLEVADNGHIVYKSGLQGTGGENSRALAERQLREWDLWQHNMKLDLAVPWGQNGYRYRFVQTYQSFPLFFSDVEVFLRDGVLQELHLNQASAHGFGDKEVTVISAQTAIETFVREAPALNKKSIIDISLGYYSLNYDAERWESAPVWRIATADGTSFYINAFTGEAEKSAL